MHYALDIFGPKGQLYVNSISVQVIALGLTFGLTAGVGVRAKGP